MAAAPRVRFPGFWIRVVADLIHSLVTFIPIAIGNRVIPFVGGCAVWILYKSLLIANWNGQTVGKKACNIKVVGDDLRPCTLGQAVGRTIAEFISTLLLCIGYLMVAFDGRKQALHDKMAGTLHIYADRHEPRPY